MLLKNKKNIKIVFIFITIMFFMFCISFLFKSNYKYELNHKDNTVLENINKKNSLKTIKKINSNLDNQKIEKNDIIKIGLNNENIKNDYSENEKNLLLIKDKDEDIVDSDIILIPIENEEDFTEDKPSEQDNIIKDEVDNEIDNIEDETVKLKHTNYIIKNGDSLFKILTKTNVSIQDISMLYNQYKDLGNIYKDQKISWDIDENNNLMVFSRLKNMNTLEIYKRNGDSFEKNEEKINGIWKIFYYDGKVDKSFVKTLNKMGIGYDEIKMITSTLQWQVDFSRIKNGDKFSIIIMREMFDNFHNDSKVLGVRIYNADKEYGSILYENGKYYDQNGIPLIKDFLKIPLDKENVRISSGFNPKRLNPVTKKVSPHNGVDFAIPTGTNILAASDGEVVLATRSGSAGLMITIRHGRQYTTRYMHLSKLLVKKGDKVKIGQVIALSGNTGRSTGSHLHYEILVDNVPKDPMKIKLPEPKPLEGEAKNEFLKQTQVIREKLGFNEGYAFISYKSNRK